MVKYMMEVRKFVGYDSYDPDAWKNCRYEFESKERMDKFVKDEMGFFDEIKAVYRVEQIDYKKPE